MDKLFESGGNLLFHNKKNSQKKKRRRKREKRENSSSKMKRRNVLPRTNGQTSVRNNGNNNFVVKAIASLDAYPKVKEDYARGSTLGAAITLICFLSCLCLFFSEYRTHLVSKIESELDVDTMGVHKFESNAERLHVYVDITFHSLACELITLDSLDAAGEVHHDVHDGHITKRRLDRDGKPIHDSSRKDDVGVTREKPNKHKHIEKLVREKEKEEAEKKKEKANGGEEVENQKHRKLQNTALAGFGGGFFDINALIHEQFPNGLQEAFKNKNKEGCEVMGYLEVNRVPGSFSISPGKSLQLGMSHIQLNVVSNLNMSHTINRLAFGEAFPGALNLLDKNTRYLPPNAVHQYFLKVVPTSFARLKDTTLATNQYSVTESSSTAKQSFFGMGSSGKPSGIYFHYELSPIRIDFKERRNSFGEFVLSVCSIIGGVATSSGILHKIIVFFQTRARGKK